MSERVISEREAMERLGRPSRTPSEQSQRDLAKIRREMGHLEAKVTQLIRGQMIGVKVERSLAGMGTRSELTFLLPDHQIALLRRAYDANPAKAVNLAAKYAHEVHREVLKRSGDAVAGDTLRKLKDEITLLWAVFERNKIKRFLAGQAQREAAKAEYDRMKYGARR
jgi:hypothetical protein